MQCVLFWSHRLFWFSSTNFSFIHFIAWVGRLYNVDQVRVNSNHWINKPIKSFFFVVNCTSILLVSDPQLLGETFDTMFYSDIAISDSDSYLRKTFSRASAFTQPDVVCFLGDLLDEGSVANDEEYKRYLKRFNDLFKTRPSVQTIHIPGDNDIGGEHKDHITSFKTKRFRDSFNESHTVLAHNRLQFFNINLLTHIYPDFNETDSKTNKFINIVLTHISVLSYPGLTMKTVCAPEMHLDTPTIIYYRNLHNNLQFDWFDTIASLSSLSSLSRLWINSNRISSSLAICTSRAF